MHHTQYIRVYNEVADQQKESTMWNFDRKQNPVNQKEEKRGKEEKICGRRNVSPLPSLQ